jgi:hypothetical protein
VREDEVVEEVKRRGGAGGGASGGGGGRVEGKTHTSTNMLGKLGDLLTLLRQDVGVAVLMLKSKFSFEALYVLTYAEVLYIFTYAQVLYILKVRSSTIDFCIVVWTLRISMRSRTKRMR